jgi:hypothetical protein
VILGVLTPSTVAYKKEEIMVASAKGTASGGELNRLSDPDG